MHTERKRNKERECKSNLCDAVQLYFVNVLLEISFIDYIVGLNFMMVSFQYAATVS